MRLIPVWYIHKEGCMLGAQMLDCPLSIPTPEATLCAAVLFSFTISPWTSKLQKMKSYLLFLMLHQCLAISRYSLLICWKKGWPERGRASIFVLLIFTYKEANSHMASQTSPKLTVEPKLAIPLPQSPKWWNYILSVFFLRQSYVESFPGTLNPPASAHWALGLQVCTTHSWLCFFY